MSIKPTCKSAAIAIEPISAVWLAVVASVSRGNHRRTHASGSQQTGEIADEHRCDAAEGCAQTHAACGDRGLGAIALDRSGHGASDILGGARSGARRQGDFGSGEHTHTADRARKHRRDANAGSVEFLSECQTEPT